MARRCLRWPIRWKELARTVGSESVGLWFESLHCYQIFLKGSSPSVAGTLFHIFLSRPIETTIQTVGIQLPVLHPRFAASQILHLQTSVFTLCVIVWIPDMFGLGFLSDDFTHLEIWGIAPFGQVLGWFSQEYTGFYPPISASCWPTWPCAICCLVVSTRAPAWHPGRLSR